MIEVQDLKKSYGDLLAVDGVSFTAEAGQVFGLLGPNGAGKSTTIGCISGLLEPTSGRVSVLGHDVAREGRIARQGLGVVPQDLAIYEDLSARENLRFWGAAYGLPRGDLDRRASHVLERIGLADRDKEAVSKFSGGMKRRLNLGCAMMHEPKVILLDEPTVGVDPQSRVQLLELVRESVDQGACVLYSTHYMEEAESLCDRLGIIDHGKLIAHGTLAELRGVHGENDFLRLGGQFEEARVRTALEGLEDLEVMHVEEGHLTLSVGGASRRLAQIFETIQGAGGEVRETTLTRPSLENLFIALTGKELRE